MLVDLHRISPNRALSLSAPRFVRTSCEIQTYNLDLNTYPAGY